MEKFNFLPAGAVIGERAIWRKYLEMTERPVPFGAVLPENLVVLRLERPTLHFYKYLYSATGLDLDWVDRLLMADGELLENVQDPAVFIYVFIEKGCPAGYFELDFRVAGEVELKYFGLMPEFRDRGWGKVLLKWAIDRAFEKAKGKLSRAKSRSLSGGQKEKGAERIRRMHFSTCELDDARALPIYLSVGFSVFLEAIEVQRVIERR